MSFDRSLIAAGRFVEVVLLIFRSSSLRAQEVRRSFCPCPLPEVLPIKAKPVSGCALSLYRTKHTFLCLFVCSFTHLPVEETVISITLSLHVISIYSNSPKFIPVDEYTSRSYVHTCCKSSSRLHLCMSAPSNQHPTLSIILLAKQGEDFNITFPQMTHVVS